MSCNAVWNWTVNFQTKILNLLYNLTQIYTEIMAWEPKLINTKTKNSQWQSLQRTLRNGKLITDTQKHNLLWYTANLNGHNRRELHNFEISKLNQNMAAIYWMHEHNNNDWNTTVWTQPKRQVNGALVAELLKSRLICFWRILIKTHCRAPGQ